MNELYIIFINYINLKTINFNPNQLSSNVNKGR